MSYINSLFHIVFCTKNRQDVLPISELEQLFRFIWSVLSEKNCKLIRINGIHNHIHILADIDPTISLSTIVRDIKARSSGWMHTKREFNKFESWAKGYYAASVSFSDRNAVIEYIKNQQIHHGSESFDFELQRLCHDSGVQYTDTNMV